MAVNRSNRLGRSLRSNAGRTSSPSASPVARPVGRPTPSTLPPAGPIRQASPSRASVSPVRRPQGESPVIRPSKETGGATPPPRTVVDKIIKNSESAILSVDTKKEIPTPRPVRPPKIFADNPTATNILGTVDPGAILAQNQKTCDGPVDQGDDIQDLIDHIDSIKDEIANIEIPILGCTDPNALNYNPSANKENGRCEYPEEPAEVVEDFTEEIKEPEPPEVKLCAAEYFPTEQKLSSAKRQALREAVGGDLDSEMKNIWDEQVVEFPIELDKDNPQYAASRKLKTSYHRNNLGIILIRGGETAKLNISLNRRFFDAEKYREVIDTRPSSLVGRIKSGKR
jgi:hypothetical protein